LEQSRGLAAACVQRAENALLSADLLDDRLMSIARWTVERRN
jgi:hypothetical protein